MRDGIEFAKRGIPAVAMVTAAFREQGDFVARAWLMPELPRMVLPHPVAGIGVDAMARLGMEVAPTLIEMLRGNR